MLGLPITAAGAESLILLLFAKEQTMLCPKCDYISFDNLTSCSKCHHDLSEIIKDLHGTTAQVEGNFFLGSVSSAEKRQAVHDYVEVEERVEAEAAEAQEDEVYQDEENVLGDLTLDLEDMLPPVDLSEIESEAEQAQEEEVGPEISLEESEPVAQEEPPAETPPEIELSALDLEEETLAGDEITSSADTDEPITLESDDQDLSLTLDMELPEETENREEEINEDQIPIDLEQIDLSDLVHSPDHPQEPDQDIEEKTSANEQGDMDLTLEMEAGDDNKVEEEQHLELEDVENDQENSPLEHLDLTLDLDETEDLQLSGEELPEENSTDQELKDKG